MSKVARQDMASLLLEIGRFGLVGFVNTFSGLCVIYTMMFVGANFYLSNLAGYIFGLLISFSLNRRWTFRHGGALNLSLILRFAVAVIISYCINLLVASLVLSAGVSPYLAQLSGLPAYTLMFYILCKFVVFR